MADDKRKAPGTAEGANRRQPPTIDLTATDITGEAEQQASAAPPQPDAPKSEPLQSEPPKTGSPKPERPNATPSPSQPAQRTPSFLPMLLAGLGGGALAAAVTVAVLLSGAMTPQAPPPAPAADNSALRAQLDAFDRRLGELAARPQPAPDMSASSSAMADVTARLGRIEQKFEQAAAQRSAGSAADAGQLAAIDSTLKALGVAVAGLNRRADEIAANALAAREEAGASAKSLGDLRRTLEQAPSPARPADVERLAKRLDGIEAAAKSASRTTAEATSIGAAVRLALAASALREAVNGGSAYAAELAAVKASGGDVTAVAALAPFADKGVPGDAALASELLTLIAPMSKAAGIDTQTGGGFLEKLQANAEKLVRVRPLDAPDGADAGAVLARLEARAARNDISGARAEIGKLPPAAQQVAGAWLKTLAARDAARNAARTIAAGATRGLAQP